MKAKQWLLAMAVAGAMAAGTERAIAATSGAVAVWSTGSLDVNGEVEVGVWPFAEAGDETGVLLDGAVLFSSVGEATHDWQPQTMGAHVMAARVNGMTVTSQTVIVKSLAFEAEQGPNPPSEANPQLSIVPTARNVGTGGGVYVITTSGSGTWNASVSDSWITLNAMSGQAGYPVAYAVSATSQAEKRTGYVYVSGHVHTVTQDGFGATVSPEEATFGHEGGVATIEVTADTGVVWQAKGHGDWMSVTPTTGSESGIVTVSVPPFNEFLTRQGTLTVAGKTVAIRQGGRDLEISPLAAANDYLTRTISVTVAAEPSQEWSVTPSVDWISVVDAGSGKGHGVVKLEIAENPSWKLRSGTVAIGTATFSVTQEGRTELVFDISPATSPADAEGSGGKITVTATPDLPWNAKSQANWVTLGASASGAGNGRVTYSVMANPTLDQRTGTIVVTPGDSTIGAKTHVVTQAAASSALSTAGHEFAAGEGSVEVRVSLANVVEWNIDNKIPWLSITGGTNRVGPGTVVLKASANDMLQPRSGTVTIAGKTFAVTQVAASSALAPTNCEFAAAGGTCNVQVSVADIVQWQIENNVAWLTVEGAANRVGPGTVMLTASANETVYPRSGSVTIARQIFMVSQKARGVELDCHSKFFGADGGSDTLAIHAAPQVAWTAVASDPTWITIFGNASGTGDGRILYVVSPIVGDENERTGSIAVGDQVVRIVQRVQVFPDAQDAVGIATVLEVAADQRLGERISTVAEYDGFRAWIAENGLDEQAVLASPHAWPSYALGAESLFGNEPTIQIDGMSVGDSGTRGAENDMAIEVSVTVRDGEKTVAVDATQIAAMFEAASDLRDWEGEGKLPVNVTLTGRDGASMQFEVVPDDGTANEAFLRLLLSHGKTPQTISFAPIGVQAVTNRVKLSASASSGGAMTFKVVAGPGVLVGDELSFTGVGSVVVRAFQRGDGRWLPMTETQTVLVKAEQTISFEDIGTPTTVDRVALSAVATSGGKVTFEVVSGPGEIAGNILSFTGAGVVEVQAVQNGDDLWLPASALQTVTVEKVEQTICFEIIDERTRKDRVKLSASATSGGEVTFEVVSGPGKIEENVLSFMGMGSVVVRAIQEGNDLWFAASTTQTVSVGKAEQTISLSIIGEPTTTNRVGLSATSSSGGAVALEVVSGPGVMDGNILSFTGEGTVEVRMTQAGNDLWLPAMVTQAVSVVADASDLLYMVVDLSSGSGAEAVYPVNYLTAEPEGGWTDEYKTTKLVLRRIEPGTFTMGSGSYNANSTCQVTLTKPYYMGVFEVTQKQYELVVGSNSYEFPGDKRPVEHVSWNTIRGDTNWPASSAVSADSFMGRLRARTGLGDFDLPTEAQWEYACRAGTTTLWNYEDNAHGNYMWYESNSSNQTHDVGIKLPNPWGLYDMYGNVWEWCLDWDVNWGGLLSGGTDPKGPSSGALRVNRGGSWYNGAAYGTSSTRGNYYPSDANGLIGFRLVSTLKSQAISFSPIGAKTTGDRVELSAKATSGGPVTFEVVSGPGEIAGNVLTFTGTGAVVVRAVQTGDDLWLPASATQTVQVQEALYMVVDLSAGSGADAVYPVRYLATEPEGGWTDEYKTTKLVLRRIEAGTFTTIYYTTLTKPYYMGVFEVTQKQYELVVGSNPSAFVGDKRPVERVPWNTIRGDTNWPASSAVSADSFMGLLRARTGLDDFDLPTSAQWEYACRAGTTTPFSYGNNADGNYMWYLANSSSQTHDVGTKLPNLWGLYDMHGNVCEWCLDWSGPSSGGSDPKGALTGTERVMRGGSWGYDSAVFCTSYTWFGYDPSRASDYIGFCLVRTLAE